MAEPLANQSLADKVFQHLKAQLANRSYKVGDRLNARQIAADLNVSRSTAIKAIDRLIADQFVKTDDSRHPIVAAVPTKLRIHEAKPFEFSNQTDSTYELFLERLLRGELSPGEVIKERPLAIEMGVNPATIRRAAEWLRGDGLLERLPRRGWRVSMLSARDMSDSFEVRLLLEPRVVAEAVRRIAEEELDQMEGDTDRLIDMGEKATVFDRRSADQQFHRGLCQASGSRTMMDILDPLISKLLLITTVGFRYGRSSQSFEEHRTVLKAIRERDEKAAVKAIKSHLRSAMKFNLEIWDRQ